MKHLFCLGLSVFTFLLQQPCMAVSPTHALSLYGDIKYAKDATHFDYVDPDAPKGGTLHLGTLGTFDSLNPFVVKGTPAPGLIPLGNSFMHCALAARSDDEPLTVYGVIAESFERAPDNMSLTINLRPHATFHDGSPITADDVVFSFQTLVAKGHPLYRAYYSHVDRVEKINPSKVTFFFKDNISRELPLIITELPILSKKYFSTHDFTKANLTPILGSGPYRIASVDAGHAIVYERVKNWWGEKILAMRGQFNFDYIRYDFYRDITVLFEGFKSGAFDVYHDTIAKNWATGYAIDAVKNGSIIKKEVKNEMEIGFLGFVFNIRKPLFQDPVVREAIQMTFDFEWANKNLFYNSYKRINSYFVGTKLEAKGKPTAAELALLEPFRDQLPPAVFGDMFQPTISDGSGQDRKIFATAKEMLLKAGYQFKDNKLVNPKGVPIRFEVLLSSPAHEPVAQHFQKTLRRIGIDMTFRVVDPAQYEQRMNHFNYDMIYHGIRQSSTPGNELVDFFGSKDANVSGSRNAMGVQDKVIDALIDAVIKAQTRQALETAVSALDRVLCFGYYMVPTWYLDKTRYAYWDKFDRPITPGKDGIGLTTWWFKPTKTVQKEVAPSE